MKTRTILILVILLLVILGWWFFASRSHGTTVSAPWIVYTSTPLGVSFEYPSQELAPAPEGSYGTSTVRIDNTHGVATTPENLPDLKMIMVSVVPTNPSEVTSLDAWIKLVENNKVPGGSAFTDVQFMMIDGERAAVVVDPKAMTYVTVFRNQTLYQVTIMNLSQDEVAHVLQSFHFTR